jgi:hypothetical protein
MGYESKITISKLSPNWKYYEIYYILIMFNLIFEGNLEIKIKCLIIWIDKK